jgi:hypothetical protein
VEKTIGFVFERMGRFLISEHLRVGVCATYMEAITYGFLSLMCVVCDYPVCFFVIYTIAKTYKCMLLEAYLNNQIRCTQGIKNHK